MGRAFDDVESGEQRRRVQRARCLTRSSADAFGHFALEDLPPLREAVLERTWTDDGIEGEDLVRQKHDTVEPRRRGLDVVRPELLIAMTRERRLKARELLVT